MNINETVEEEYCKKRAKHFRIFVTIVAIILLILPAFGFGYLLIQIGKLGEKVDLFQSQLLLYIEHNSSKVIDEEYIESENEPTLSSGVILEPNEIYVEEELIESTLDSGGKRVYLTFDDGPSYYTGKILDILAEYDVLATFFVVGDKPERMDDLYVRIVEEGHEIAAHSYTHDYAEIYQSPEALLLDIQLIQEKIKALTGTDSMIYRFPGGSSNNVIKNNIGEYIALVEELGLVYYDWNVSVIEPSADSGTSAKMLADTVVNEILKNNYSIVLMHDDYYKPITVQALPLILEQLQNEEIEILPITEQTIPIKHVEIQ